MKPEMKYIGKQITIKAIKDFIVDSGLKDEKIILLNSKNFDDIVLEYRSFYNESIQIPYYLTGVLVTEDNTEKVPIDRIGLIDNDDEFESKHFIYEETFDLYDGEYAYQCAFCGNIVDEKGKEIFGEDRNRVIRYIGNFKDSIVNRIYGKCCENKYW